MIMITDNDDSDENPNQICCDGVNIAILVWKGNKFVDKKVASVCFFCL